MAWPPKTLADILQNADRIYAAVEFVEEMGNLRILSNTGGALLRRSPATRSYTLDTRGTVTSEIPAIAGQTGKFLTNDGAALSWGAAGGASDYTRIIRILTDQTIPNATQTAISFDSVTDNPSGLWSAGTPTRITVPTAGIWLFGIEVQWRSNGTGLRWMIMEINSTLGNVTPSVTQVPLPTDQTHQALSVNQRMAANDYVVLKVYQASGGNLNVGAAVITAVRMGD